ncbi:hypothetical protein B0H19DRAFT_1120404 [Mycena capillaripes]|nr:hypothetical protein B0H19DRAFT_1120404 [Mycena capillaripes]
MASSSSSSSSSSPSSSSPEYMTETVSLVYPSAFLTEKTSRPFRVITPASSLQLNKRKRDLLDTDTAQPRANYPEMSQFRVVVRQPFVAAAPGSSFGPSGKLKAKPPKAYKTSEELLSALRTTCLEDSVVDFSGSYLLAGNDAHEVSDKQRIQMVINDIWKSTGYRFTVKDHPPTENGHKTRLWCSQDEARRSKHRTEPPRLSRQGEQLSKPRFPCRSRLMIACLPDAQRGGRIVTVRLHHYMRHEAYSEAAYEASTAVAPPSLQFLGAITATLPPQLMNMPVAPPPALDEQEGEWDVAHPHQKRPHQKPPQSTHYPHPEPPRTEPYAHQKPPPPEHYSQPPQPAAYSHQPPHIEPTPPSPSPSPHFAPAPAPAPPPEPQSQLAHHLHSRQRAHPPSRAPQPPSAPPPPQQQPQPTHPANPMQTHPAHPAQTHPAPPQPTPHPITPTHPAQLTITPEEFQHRMRTHIARIRDFCDGLEYQVQYNDYRMLEALERDAAPFLGLLEDCLRREGRMT